MLQAFALRGCESSRVAGLLMHRLAQHRTQRIPATAVQEASEPASVIGHDAHRPQRSQLIFDEQIEAPARAVRSTAALRIALSCRRCAAHSSAASSGYGNGLG